MKNILFPQGFQRIGWVLFVPSIIVALLCYTGFCSVSGTLETIVNDAIIIGIALGAVFIVCSKEPHEDEMISSLRLASLLNALYTNIILLITSTLVLNGVAFLRFAVANLVLLPVIYVVLFRLEIQRHNKMLEGEE